MDLKPSPSVKSRTIPAVSSPSTGQASPATTTCEPSQQMLWPETELPSMSSAAGSRARISALQESKQGWTEQGQAYGQRLPVSWASFDRNTSSWRMSQVCLVALLSNQADGLAEYSETWPRSGTMRNGTAFQLPALVPLTDATECGLLPTPKAMDSRSAGPGTKIETLKRRASSGWGLNLAETAQVSAREMFPTPNARDWKDTTAASSLAAVEGGHQITLGRAVHLWPTPTANRYSGLQSHGNNAILGSLNPNWVEWLMGYPIGWSGLRPSATPLSLKSPNSSAARSSKRRA